MRMRHNCIGILALVVFGILATGCSDLRKEKNPDGTVTLTTTVTIDDGTKALAADGKKTFATGDKIAVIYKKSGSTVKAESEALAAEKIKRDGKYAEFTVTLENPDKTQDVTFIYPAAMAKADGTVNYEALAQQDGQLATISSNLDCCTYTGPWEDSDLPKNKKLSNLLTICAFSVKHSDGGDLAVTQLVVTVAGNTYTVNPSPATSLIYVAMRPVTSADIAFTATTSTHTFEKTVSDKTLTVNNFYPINLTLTPVPATFVYTGSEQTFTVPSTGWYTIQAYGAEGGKAYKDLTSGSDMNDGGKGGYSSISYYLTKNQTLYIYCGGKGGDATRAAEGGGTGGWNGGGNGGNGNQSTYTGGGGGGGATHVATTQIGDITSTNSLYTGDYVARNGLILVAGGGGGNGYNGCVAGDGGGDSWTVGKRASDGDADANYKNGTNVTFTGSQGGTGKTSTSTTGNQKGGSGGHGGGFKAVSTLKGQQQTYAGCGGSGWGDTTNGRSFSTSSGGATAGGDGKVIITWICTPMQGVNDYTVQSGQSW